MARMFLLEMTEQEADAMTEAWGVISALACAEPLLATMLFERFLQKDTTLTEKVTKLLHEVATAKGLELPNQTVSKDEQATRDSWAGRLGDKL